MATLPQPRSSAASRKAGTRWGTYLLFIALTGRLSVGADRLRAHQDVFAGWSPLAVTGGVMPMTAAIAARVTTERNG